MVATTDEAAVQPRPATQQPRRSEPEALFIVGVGSSGTTLLRLLLQTSDRLAIARENNFVGHHLTRQGARFYFRSAGDLGDDDSIRRLVAMIYSGDFQRRMWWRNVSRYWRWLVEAVPREEVERRLLAAERSERGLMAAFMRLHADIEGKPVMGEKTPAHLKHVDTLLEWFPGGRVIHIIRDPRAVYVSDVNHRRKDRRKPYRWLMPVPLLLEAVVLIQTIFFWSSAARRHRRYERQYPERYMLVRFEDLVTAPDDTLPRLSNFIGVDIPEDATERMASVRHGIRTVTQGLDPGAATRWRERIHPFAARFLELFLGRAMRRLGYAD
jgi:hypothetical protein